MLGPWRVGIMKNARKVRGREGGLALAPAQRHPVGGILLDDLRRAI